MSFRDSRAHLEDIRRAIEDMEHFVVGHNLQSYEADRKTQSAVERQLQIVSEAAVRLGDDAERLCPGHDWRDIRGLGNHLRHGYHLVNTELIWRITQHELRGLKADILKALAMLSADLQP